ncbi:TPA: DNA-binding domain-containing protein, partial [Enterobacter kobei]
QPSTLPAIDDIILEAAKLARGDGLAVSLLPISNPDTLAIVLPSVAPTTENTTTSVLETDLQSAVSSTHPPLAQEQLPAETLAQPNENTPLVTEVLLSSALDAPVNDKPLAEMVLAPETMVGVEEDMQALLSLMAVEVSVPTCLDSQEEGDAPKKEIPLPEEKQGPVHDITTVIEEVRKLPDVDVIEPDLSEVTDATIIPVSQPSSRKPQLEGINNEGDLIPENNIGDVFWRWLSDGLNSNEIAINTVGARVHLVSGFVFITVPGVFYLYLKQVGLDGSKREALQESFEHLEKHRRVKGKRFYFAHLYETSERTGAFKRSKGYLVKANLLYRKEKLPGDSPVLVIP